MKRMILSGILCAGIIACPVSTLFSQDAQDPLSKDLTFYAPLDGSAEASIAGGLKAATKENDIKFAEGKFGKGAEFTGKAVLNYSGDMNFNITAGTVAFWIKKNEKWSAKRAYTLFKAVVGPGWNRNSLFVMVTEHNELRLWIWDDSQKQFIVMSNPQIPYAANEWHHVTATFKDGDTRLFVDGEEISYGPGVKPNPTIAMPSGVPKAIQFGSDYNEAGVLNGVMDELRIYKRALSPEEVRKLYQLVPEKKN